MVGIMEDNRQTWSGSISVHRGFAAFKRAAQTCALSAGVALICAALVPAALSSQAHADDRGTNPVYVKQADGLDPSASMSFIASDLAGDEFQQTDTPIELDGALDLLPPAGSPDGNVLKVVQTGSSNTVNTLMDGAANRAIQIQTGNGHVSNLTLDGVGNDALVRQEGGNGNVSDLTFKGDGYRVEHIQIGSGLELTMSREGAGVPISIRQESPRP